MDKLLIEEMPQLALDADGAGGYQFVSNSNTDYRPFVGSTAWVCEKVINLEGYSMADMTTYFRQSFEQRGGSYSVNWDASTSKPLVSFNASYIEIVLVSTVPMSDANLTAAILVAPGFIATKAQALTGDVGNFDREMIIHGRYYIQGIDSSLGSDPLDAAGAAFGRIVQQQDFSSLQPVAVDKLYCYRIISLPSSFTLGGAGALTQVGIPGVRVILDATMQTEDEIPYLMRLKRGYELANQV